MNEPSINNIKIPVEVFSRVAGYFRPVQAWNKGKKEEFSQRKPFDITGAICIEK